MSSLDPKDAIPDYSELSPSDMGVLNDWHAFFTYVVIFCFFFLLFVIFIYDYRKRYNVVGRVVDHPIASDT